MRFVQDQRRAERDDVAVARTSKPLSKRTQKSLVARLVSAPSRGVSSIPATTPVVQMSMIWGLPSQILGCLIHKFQGNGPEI